MFCKNCGKVIADSSLECEYCGVKQLVEVNNDDNNKAENTCINEMKNQSDAVPTPYYTQQSSGSASVQNSKKILFITKIIICAIGILMGALLMINGFAADDAFFSISFSGYGDYPDKAVFGADFYTEIHDAVRDVARNTNEIVDLLVSFLQTFAIVFGSFMILISGFALCLTIEKRNKN